MPKIKVLYIEDDKRQRQSFAAELASRGFEIISKSSGKTALDYFEESSCDVILCDLHMPGMDGLEVLRCVRQVDRDIPVILSTAHGSVSIAVEAVKQGAYHFVLKPLEINDIEITIHQAVEYSRLQTRVTESESQISRLMDTVPDIIYSLNNDGEFTSVNSAVKSVLGYKPSEVIGTKVFDYLLPEDREQMEQGYRQAGDECLLDLARFELPMVAKNGDVRHLEISRRLIIEDGRAVRTDGIARDVTERVKLQAQLKKYSEELELMVKERTDKLEYVNRQLTALNEMSNCITQIRDEDELLNIAPMLLTDALGFERAWLMLEVNGKWQLRSSSPGDDPEMMKKSAEILKDAPAEIPPQLTDALRENKTVFVPDVRTDARWPEEANRLFDVDAVLITPLKVRSKPISVIIGDVRHHERGLEAQDIARFEMVAGMVALALENIRSYQSLEDKVDERTESLHEANRQLRDKARQLENAALELGKANVELLSVQEKLEQKNAEMEELLEELVKSKEELQAILDSSLAAIVMVNQQRKITAVNRRVTDFFGVPVEDIIHTPFAEFIDGIADCFRNRRDFGQLASEFEQRPTRIPEGETIPIQSFDTALELVGPAVRYVNVFSLPVRGKDDDELGRVWIFADITAIKRADEQLRKIIEASPIPIIVSRYKDGQILFANDHLGDLVGYTKDELIGHFTPGFYYDLEDRRRLFEIFERDGQVRSFEVRLKRKDGAVIWTIFSLVATELGGEKVVMGGIYDISERKMAEAALQKERSFVSAVLDTAGALVVVLDAEGRIVRFNRACEKISGYSAEEVIGKGFWDIFLLPEERELVEERFERIKSGPYPVTGDNYWLTKDGDRRLIAWSNTALFDDEGAIEYVVAIGIDITEHRQAVDALRVSEERFRTLVENANDLICSLTPEGKFSYISPRFPDITGYEVDEFVGKSFLPLLHPDEIPESKAWIEKGIYEGQTRTGYEFRGRHKNGSWRWFRSNSSVVTDENGEILEIIAILHDITEIKKVMEDLELANRELKEAQARLVQSEKMASLGMLVAGIAHEINTPIGAVSSMHDTLIRAVKKLRGRIDDGALEGCEQCHGLQPFLDVMDEANRVIESGSERVTTIVRRLRSFARLDEAELKKVDIHEGLEDTLMLIHHETKNRITVTKDYGEIPPVACYPGRLNQVFLNLLNNARQAIKDKGEINIATCVKDDTVRVAIRDSGTGIPREKLKNIFDPGFTTKGVGVGTGLGLSIVRQIMQDHNGRIELQSELGKGTTFRLILPVR